MNRRVAVGVAAALAVAAAAWWWWPRPAQVQGPPRFAHPQAEGEPASSTFLLPILVPYADLQALVEAQVPASVVAVRGEEVQAGWSLDLDVTRPAGVWVRGDGPALVVEVPLKVDARLFRARRAERRAERGKDDAAGVTVSFEAAVELGLALTVDEAWGLRSTTTADLRWVDPPTATVGGVSIPVRKPVEKALAGRLTEVAAQVDARLAEQDPVRKAVEKAWTELGSARQLSVDPPVWLVGSPEALYAGPLVPGPTGLELLAGYQGRFRTVLGDPGPQPAPPPLPARQDPPADAGFELVLPIALRWEALSDQVMREVGGRFFPSKHVADGAVEARDLALYPSGDQVVVRLDWSATHPTGSAVGTAWFAGRPELDPVAREVRITGFDYRLDTTSSAVWGANAIAESQLEAWVREQLVFPYGDRLDTTLEQVNAQLAAGRSPPSDGAGAPPAGTLRAEVASVEPVAVSITEPALVVAIRARGQASFTAIPRPPPPGAREPPSFHR